MNTSAFIGYLRRLPSYQGQVAHIESMPAREPSYAELDRPLPPTLEARLHSSGQLPLYTHQAATVKAARQGGNVMVATSSASGKTLCYNLAVLEAILAERGSRALYIFPTKALAQDQLRGLRQLACPDMLGLDEILTFDGDTPAGERAEIKRKAKVLLTNPDMLHVGILPNHGSWSRLLRRLRYVVVDEAHIYRGILGSHVAQVLRRLRRLCALYGSNPQFILCSATIANPGEHAQGLVGLPFEVVANDGSPHGGKDFVFWNPPIIEATEGKRRSANSEATTLFTELVRHDIRSLAFARSRRLTELIYIYSRDLLAEADPQRAGRIKPYRAGYLAEARRRTEQELFHGQLLGVVATTALELGVDIGDLEATVLTGYPGSIASAWQQAGRSGRGRQRSLSFLIGLDNPLDQYFMRHPEAFFHKTFEHALINPANPHILKPHLLCAAWELPLAHEDEGLFGAGSGQARQELEEEGRLRCRQATVQPEQGRKRWYLSPGIAYPAQQVNIRSVSGKSYTVVDASRGYELLETVEPAVAFFQVHPGAIYLHQGESYLITRLDLSARIAYAAPTEATYYTQTKEITDLKVLRVLAAKEAGGVKVHLGEVEVTTTVIGFKRKLQFTEEVIGEEPLDLPPQCFPTVALWFDPPQAARQKLARAGLDFVGGLHAAEHATISMLPLFALCDRNDIGGVSTPAHAGTGKAQVFIYDAHPGGIGIAEKGFELVAELWQAALRAIAGCPCHGGCPSCVQSPKCGNNNEPLDKIAAQVLLEWLVSL